MRAFEFEKFEEFLKTQSSATKVYIGGDSARLSIQGKWYADYAIVAIVHVDGCRGCRVFGEMTREPDYDTRGTKPSNRLMLEVFKISDLFLRVEHLLKKFEVEIHLDLNKEKKHMSNVVVQQAVGFIKGTCQIEPKIKPDAFAASNGADRLKLIWHHQAKGPHFKLPKRRKQKRKQAA